MLRLSLIFTGFLLGVIGSNTLSLRIPHNFKGDPPSFTLVADTVGGPPVIYIWLLNGDEISEGGPFHITQEVHGINTLDVESVNTVLQQSRYRSTLSVTGNVPGSYEYSVTNRAMTSNLTSSYYIQGIFKVTGYTLSTS